jgi:hypothetical protein
VAAMASSTVTDRFVYPKRLLGQIDVTGDTPILLNKHLVEPGSGWLYRCGP